METIKKTLYVKPELKIVYFQTEQGFAASFNEPGKENGSW